jgi:hypothetical protein
MAAAMARPKPKKTKRTDQPLLDQLEDQSDEQLVKLDTEAVKRIRVAYKAVRLKRRRGPQTRSDTHSEKEVEAKNRGMDVDRLISGFRLFGKKDEDLQPVRDAIAAAEAWFKNKRYTRWYDEPGVRLVKKGRPTLDGEYEIIDDRETDDNTHLIVYADEEGKHQRTMLTQEEHERRVTNLYLEWKTRMEALIATVRTEVAALAAKWPSVIRRQLKALGTRAKPEHFNFNPVDVYDVVLNHFNIECDPELAILDPRGLQAEMDYRDEMYRATVARERQEDMEAAVRQLNSFAKAMSERWLLDGQYEIVVRKTQRSGKVVVTFLKDRKEETVILEAEEVAERVSLDDKPRKFNNATVAKLFAMRDQIRINKDEDGITSPESEALLGMLDKLLEGHDPASLAEELRGNEGLKQAKMNSAVAIIATALDSRELRPRRALLRGVLIGSLRDKAT